MPKHNADLGYLPYGLGGLLIHSDMQQLGQEIRTRSDEMIKIYDIQLEYFYVY